MHRHVSSRYWDPGPFIPRASIPHSNHNPRPLLMVRIILIVLRTAYLSQISQTPSTICCINRYPQRYAPRSRARDPHFGPGWLTDSGLGSWLRERCAYQIWSLIPTYGLVSDRDVFVRMLSVEPNQGESATYQHQEW
jgi:hypothetical protein